MNSANAIAICSRYDRAAGHVAYRPRSILIAPVGGVVLNLNYHWKQLPLPKRLIVGHAVAAVAGFVLLVVVTWTTRTP